MYPFYPQPPYSAPQPPNPASVMPLPLHRFMYPPKPGFSNQPYVGPNPPHYEDVDPFPHKPGVTGNFLLPSVIPFPQGTVDQAYGRNTRSGRIPNTNFKATVQGSTTTGQSQNTTIPSKPVHEPITEGPHGGSILYAQQPRQTKHRSGTYPDDYHPQMDYYVQGQQPSFQSFPFGGVYPVHVRMQPQYGNSNPTNSPLQRHDNPRGREGDGPPQ